MTNAVCMVVLRVLELESQQASMASRDDLNLGMCRKRSETSQACTNLIHERHAIGGRLPRESS